MSSKAQWRIIEEMSPAQRLELLCGETQSIAWQPIALPEVSEEWSALIPHTPLWIRARRSFTHSREWREFRERVLQEHPRCAKCGLPADTVHHKGVYTMDATVIPLGFAWIFQHPKCCEAVCRECHYGVHETLIAAEARASIFSRVKVVMTRILRCRGRARHAR